MEELGFEPGPSGSGIHFFHHFVKKCDTGGHHGILLVFELDLDAIGGYCVLVTLQVNSNSQTLMYILNDRGFFSNADS